MFSKLGAVGIRGATLLLGILSITLTAPFLGISDFGRYALLQSIIAWTVLVALGLPETCSGIINKFRQAPSFSGAKAYFDNSFIAIAITASAFAVPLLMVSLPWPWSDYFGQMRPFAIGLFLALLSIPFTLTQSVLNANGEIARSMAWAFMTAALTVISILLVIHVIPLAADQRLLAVVIASGSAVFVSRLVMHVVETRRAFKTSWPSSRISAKRLKVLSKSAYPFLILTLAALAAFQVDRLVTFYFLPSADVAKLEVVMKVLMAAYALNTVFNAKLWHSIGEVWNAGDGKAARRTLKRALWSSAAYWSAAGLAVALLIEPVIRIFTRGALEIDDPFFVATAFAYVAARGLVDAVSISIFATRNQHQVIKTVLMHGVLNIPCSIVGCALLGLPGIMIGQLLTILLTSGWRFPILFREITRARL
jgi:O-antigen/teichoic acid export membrane protein